MEQFPQSSVGLPSSMQYQLPPSLSDSARSYSVAVAPNGISLVTGQALPSTIVANGTGSNLGNFV